ncbi:hypothetical protein [Synoicihabitans lomoniglobus]|uniref:Uncharacterized protein n=1 Tax=Synoicihabitans lomoniglobus TaxID=2909285 RepID=A0AAE9ZUI6_9BACT|nr:hypothetical protein [Opitutaceae bacterium LMO-M01]WED63551.1 hypothetical protein PXH66_14535 [Opitutaceae bacterium LMO-M01]
MNADDPKVKPSAKTLWLGVGVLFVLMAIAWTILLTLASRNPVESVPVEHRSNP